MFGWLKRVHQRYLLRKYPLDDALWQSVSDSLPLVHPLSQTEKLRLRELATLFIRQKTFFGAQALDITSEMKLVVAAQACLLVLELGLESFDGWYEVILYPGAFRVAHENQDETGLVSRQSRVLSGESWMQGPVILSWEDVERDSFTLHAGHHVVLHEFAHKLDMLNGRANGMPPLHPDMRIAEWTDSLSRAYERLRHNVERYENELDAYATVNPAEFFAVVCEYFFTSPVLLHSRYPQVYAQLKAYFRQDPLSRYN